ncbi:MAG TPA: hypothetical protein VMB03_30110 [Bryobacteraceae bacterium]|nr:hypothetical protein [Bryobacteraceae bacterium]
MRLSVGGCCLLLAVAGWANETSALDSVKSTVAALNDPAARGSLFTSDASGRFQLEGLLSSPGTPNRALPDVVRLVPERNPTVVISHEPLGEAQIVIATPAVYFNGVPRSPKPPHIASRGVRFVTSNVAVVDAVVDNPAQGFANFQPLLAGSVNQRAAAVDVVLILVKQGGNWLVSVARVAK